MRDLCSCLPEGQLHKKHKVPDSDLNFVLANDDDHSLLLRALI